MKKLTSILLVFIIVINFFSVSGLSVSAYTVKDKYKDFEYEYEFSTYKAKVTNYCGNDSGVRIPEKISYLTVDSIGSCMFLGNSTLKSVTIPDSIRTIESYAFCECTNLRNVSFGKGVTNIGEGVFDSCSALTSITLPDSIVNISDWMFHKCTNLTYITIPSGVTSIGKRAFYDCESLRIIDIPDGVTNIGSDAFTYTAYYKNTANWENGVLYIGNHLIKSTASGEYTIKEGTRSIASGAFSDCKNLTSVVIPTSLKAIGKGAFDGCSGLTTVYIPKGLELDIENVFPSQTKIIYTEIEPYVVKFYGNGGYGAPQQMAVSALENTFTVPNSVPTRKNYAFVGWSEKPNAAPAYTPGNTYTINKNLTLYAVWKTTYTIKYKLCGGYGNIPDQVKTEGIDLILNTVRPTHNNYTFAYWISSDRKTTYHEGSTYRNDANDTLYAVWKEKCPKCDGSQFSSITKCNTCKGKGTVTTSYTCTNCKGTGKKTKTSYETCSNCHGSGTYYGYGLSTNGMGWQFLPCPYCNAKGTIKKVEQVTCTTCGGDGIESSTSWCPECHHAGQIKTKCDECEGKGYFYHYPDYNIEDNPDPYPNSTLTLGDVDGDSDVTIVDATCIQRHLAELAVISYNETAADADGDGEVTIMDATAIQRFVAELPTHDGIGKYIS